MRWILTASLALVFVLSAAPALANSADRCIGDTPQFRAGFGAIAAAVGGRMGAAITCEYPDPNGTGDTEQLTTTGLGYWRKSTNTPTFYDGSTHYAITAQGYVSWVGVSVDPPVAVAQPAAMPTAAYRCRQFCFMVPDGKGFAAVEKLITAGVSPSPLTILRLVTSGDVYRLTAGATLQVDDPTAERLHIHVLNGNHADEGGWTIRQMVAGLP